MLIEYLHKILNNNKSLDIEKTHTTKTFVEVKRNIS
jgi:hypothetical protein